MERLGIGENVLGDDHLRRLGARLGHLRQYLLLLFRISLHRLDEVGDEVIAPLVLVEHLAPGGLRSLFIGGDSVDAAAGQSGGEHQQRKDADGERRGHAKSPWNAGLPRSQGEQLSALPGFRNGGARRISADQAEDCADGEAEDDIEDEGEEQGAHHEPGGSSCNLVCCTACGRHERHRGNCGA